MLAARIFGLCAAGLLSVLPGSFTGSLSPSSSPAGQITSGPQMLSPRSGHTATLLPDGRVLIAGGMRRNHDFLSSGELYDPRTKRFEPTGEMNLGRVGHVAVLLQTGKVLIAGGWANGATNSAEVYDPATGRFTLISPMARKRGEACATLLRNGDVLITGGSDQDGPGSDIVAAEIFDAKTMAFRPAGSMHYARVSHTATLLEDGRVLIVGGRSENVVPVAELYDPRSGTFAETGKLITARYKHTAALLPGGGVLIAGGSDERDWKGELNSAEIFDVHTGRFIAAAAMNAKRFKLPHEAARLHSGMILIAGGDPQAEVFDPRSGTFTLVAGEIDNPRHFMTETLLQSGAVLLAGGYFNNDVPTARTWIFQP